MKNAESELPWAVRVEADEAGRWQRIVWSLSSAGLREALLGRPEHRQTRGIMLTETRSVLLLSDVITLDDGLVAMNILARPDPSARGMLKIEAQLTAEHDLGRPLNAVLQWSGRTLTTAVDETGRAAFDGVPADSLVDPQTGRALTDLRLLTEHSSA